MKWNDIREKIKNPTDSMNVRTEKSTVVSSSASVTPETRMHSKRRLWIIAGAVIVLAAIIIIWCIQSKKVTDYGPATDAGITRQEAKDAEVFLQQIPLKPLTPEQRKAIEDSTKGMETSESTTASSTANKKVAQ